LTILRECKKEGGNKEKERATGKERQLTLCYSYRLRPYLHMLKEEKKDVGGEGGRKGDLKILFRKVGEIQNAVAPVGVPLMMIPVILKITTMSVKGCPTK